MKISVSVLVARPLAEVWQGWHHGVERRLPTVALSPKPGGSAGRGAFLPPHGGQGWQHGVRFRGHLHEIRAPTGLRYVMDDGREVSVQFVEEQGGTRVEEVFDAESQHSDEQQRAGWQSILDNFKRHMEATG